METFHTYLDMLLDPDPAAARGMASTIADALFCSGRTPVWSRVTTPSTKSLLAYGAEGPAGAAAAALKNVGNAFIAKATAVTGDTPQDILRSMGEAFNELIEAVRDEERAIQDALAELDGFLSGPRNASLLPREIDPAYGVEAPRPYPERRGMPR